MTLPEALAFLRGYSLQVTQLSPLRFDVTGREPSGEVSGRYGADTLCLLARRLQR